MVRHHYDLGLKRLYNLQQCALFQIYINFVTMLLYFLQLFVISLKKYNYPPFSWHWIAHSMLVSQLSVGVYEYGITVVHYVQRKMIPKSKLLCNLTNTRQFCLKFYSHKLWNKSTRTGIFTFFKYTTTSVLFAFKIENWKYEVPNVATSGWCIFFKQVIPKTTGLQFLFRKLFDKPFCFISILFLAKF